MKCPTCGAEASGNFCASCGGPLKAPKCPSCGTAVPPGSRFCTSCGKAMPGIRGGKGPGARSGASRDQAASSPLAPPSPSSNLAWWVAGALLVVVLVALGYPILSGGAGGPTGGGGSGGPSGAAPPTAGAIDLTTMSLEEQATLLFNRVMTSNSTGDTADVSFFLPKALVIYEQLAPSDPDGIYHYALLHQVGGDHAAALAKAQEGLAQVPTFLLLLAVAAESELAMGDTAAARGHYELLVQSYDEEMALLRYGYDHHSRILPSYLEEAQAFLRAG